jgi:hypothetical protein
LENRTTAYNSQSFKETNGQIMTTTKVLNGFKQWDSPTPFAADFVIWWKPQGANSLSPIEFVKPEKKSQPQQIHQPSCIRFINHNAFLPWNRQLNPHMTDKNNGLRLLRIHVPKDFGEFPLVS